MLLVMCSHRCMHANPEIYESGGTVHVYLGVWGHVASSPGSQEGGGEREYGDEARGHAGEKF